MNTEEPNVPLTSFNLVEKYYRMNPLTEDMIFAYQLQVGMSALVANYTHRIDLMHMSNEPSLSDILKTNRWCTVTNIFHSNTTSDIYFIGVYEDGSKYQRHTSTEEGWLVKLDSITPTDKPLLVRTDSSFDTCSSTYIEPESFRMYHCDKPSGHAFHSMNPHMDATGRVRWMD